MLIIEKVKAFAEKHPDWFFFLKYTVLFTMLLLSLASTALFNIISTESNPFFYANF